MNLPAGTTTGRTSIEYKPVYILHAEAPVYYPAEDGLGSYCNTAVCTHQHPDTAQGKASADRCAARLARMIAKGTLPAWARLTNPI